MSNGTEFEAFEAFEAYYDEAKGNIDQRITEILADNEEFTIKRRMLEHSTRGGKRLRPVLTMLVSDVYGSPYDKAINHAAIVELIHNASLVADDRADNDATRRGAPALWKIIEKLPLGRRGHKFITGATVMAENGLVALAFQLAAEHDVAQAVAHGMRKLVDGFFLEGANVFEGVVGGGYDKYVEINKAKTGGLFALAAWMPATYVDAPEEQVDAARKYGETLGILYQIADDIADDDLPSYIPDPAEELEKWYDKAQEQVERMPPDEKEDLLRAAPAWVVYRMFEQEEMLGEIEPSFLPPAKEV
jgi:geranylgeranyl diphosphate synthase type I